MTPREVRFRQVMPPPKKKNPQTSVDSDEQIAFADAGAFDRWLESNHASCPGVWLRIAKKGSARKRVSYPEALEVALAWGWIDARSARSRPPMAPALHATRPAKPVVEDQLQEG